VLSKMLYKMLLFVFFAMLEKEIINIFIISTLFGSEGHGLRVKNTI
jgi:hypothetical protein